MPARRLLGTLLTGALTAASLTAVGLVGTAAPAAAATATKIVGSDSKHWITGPSYRTQPGVPKYGDKLNLSINVVTSGGDQVYDGTLLVERRLAGSKSWKTVKKSDSAYLYDSIKAVGNADYRVTYSGTADYAASNAGVTSKIQRKLVTKNISGRVAGVSGKVVPKKRTTVTAYKKVGRHYKRYKTIHTSKAGRFRLILPAPRSGRFYWKVVFKGDRHFVPSVLKGSTY